MIDQANDLRNLVTQAASRAGDAPTPQVTTVLVAGGKGGVGTTTIAVNLAAVAAQQGMRTVLVDADPDGPDIQTLCRLRQRHTICDVIQGRRTLVEALQPGPGGITVLPGAWGAADLADAPDVSQKRFIDQLAGLANRADLVVLDGGNGLHPFTRRLWHACRELVLVSSTDASAVLDTYAALKIAVDPVRRPQIQLLVNMCTDAGEAAEVHGRIRRSCRRFLGFDLPVCRWIGADPNVVAAGRHGLPFALSPQCAAAHQSLAALAGSFDRAVAQLDRNTLASPREWQIETNEGCLPNRLNLDRQNADNEEDRSLFARC